MFNDKQYFQVNREERHFGFLLMAAIIYDESFRKQFFELINERINQKLFLDYNNFDDIYGEVAILRDYWNDLGDFKGAENSNETNNRRKAIIEQFLEYFNIAKDIIGKYLMFWTGEIGKSKLWFPGKWSFEGIEIIQDEKCLKNRELLRLRWACNAKPDLMIISGRSCLLIELKVESGVGTSNFGYNQEETQDDILKLTKLTVPYFNNMNFKKIMLTKGKGGDINWDEIKSMMTDELSVKHFENMPNSEQKLS
jgi:hypothetical protein